MHIAIDSRSMNAVSLTITDEHRHDTKEFWKSLHPIVGKTEIVYGDGAFDQSPLFDKLHSLDIEPVIKMRKNASTEYARGSKFRRWKVREYRNLVYKNR